MKAYRSYLLDLDGVVYRGEQILPGARDFVAWLEATGRDYRYLSNNSMASPSDVAAKLTRLGIPTPDERVVTASFAAVQLVAERFPGGRAWIVGLPSLRAMADRAGLRVLNLMNGDMPDNPEIGPETADVVLVGLDRALTYEGLRMGLRALLAGADFITVNRDPMLPVEDGFDPGCGAIVAALEASSRRTAEMVGKPSPDILHLALETMHASYASSVMVGDALEMDIAAGQAAGVDTVLVLSGITDASRAANHSPAPTLIVRDLADLLDRMLQTEESSDMHLA